MCSRANEVPNEINKRIVKRTIKNKTAILEESKKNGTNIQQPDKFSQCVIF